MRLALALALGVTSVSGVDAQPPVTSVEAAQSPIAPRSPTDQGKSDRSYLPVFGAALARAVSNEDVIGLAAAVVHQGQIVLLETHGLRRLGDTAPIGPDTTFRMASLSKAFGSAAVAQIVAEGRLTLDAKIAPFAPAFRLKGARHKTVTVDQVLTHRLGLPPYAFDNLLEAGIEPSAILRRLGGVEPICPVGRCYGYQNVAFNTVTDVVEAVDGRSYGAALADRFFEPLAMGGAGLGLEHLQRTEDWARPHRRDKAKAWRTVAVRPPYYTLPAAGGVNASISDMAVWLSAQMGHAPDVLSADMLTMLHTPRVRTPGEIHRRKSMTRLENAHYGLGWRIYEYAGHRLVNHSGSVEGYSAQIAFLPQRDIGLVLMTNARQAKAFWRLMPLFLDLELGLVTEASLTQEAPDAGTP